MRNTKLSMVKELQAKLTEDFTVTQDSNGNISIYSNIEEYFLNEEEVQQLLRNLGYSIRWFIVDENCQHVHADSIKRISKYEYTYSCYPKMERSYNNQESAELALLKLESDNYRAKMSHHFKVKSMLVSEPISFVIKDNNGRFCDNQSIFILADDDKQLKWWYKSFSTEINSIFRYPTFEYAESVLNNLNRLKEVAGFNDIEFHIEEFTRESTIAADMTVVKIPVPKGLKGAHRKLYREIVKQYMN